MWLSKLLYVLLGTALLALTSCERGGSGGWDPAPQEDASESSDGAWSADTEAPPNTALDQGAGAGADAGPDATDSSVALGPQPDAQQPSGGGGSDATDYGFDAGPQGPACADYCALHAHCTRDNALYASESDCLMQCGAWARWPAGLEGDSENTIACRLAQLEAIAEGGSPDEHCSAAGPTGGDVCGSWCDNYCALALANCTGTHTLYSGEVDCQIACSNIPEDGEHYAVEGDSVQCRIRQLMLAGSDRGGPAPGQYCPAASLSGAPPCGRASGIGCGEAVLVDELPFVAEADNTDVGSSFHLEAGACDGFFFARGQMGSDHAYVLTAEQTGVYTITLEASFDTLLYVATSCPDVSPSCVEYSDSWGDEEIDLEAQAGQTYYIIVDTDAETPTEGGPYRLTVEEPCIPSCDGRICGHDGCDGSCGECGLGKVCSDEGTCVDPNTVPGNTCANAFDVRKTALARSRSRIACRSFPPAVAHRCADCGVRVGLRGVGVGTTRGTDPRGGTSPM